MFGQSKAENLKCQIQKLSEVYWNQTAEDLIGQKKKEKKKERKEKKQKKRKENKEFNQIGSNSL